MHPQTISDSHSAPWLQPGTPATAPTAPPISQDELDGLVNLLTSCKQVLIISGAGASTESGTPDYRGVRGAYTTGYKPTTHQQVLECCGIKHLS